MSTHEHGLHDVLVGGCDGSPSFTAWVCEVDCLVCGGMALLRGQRPWDQTMGTELWRVTPTARCTTWEIRFGQSGGKAQTLFRFCNAITQKAT